MIHHKPRNSPTWGIESVSGFTGFRVIVRDRYLLIMTDAVPTEVIKISNGEWSGSM